MSAMKSQSLNQLDSAQFSSDRQNAAAGLRLALPSDGELYEPSLAFLRSCGVPVHRSNVRRYTAKIPSVPGTTVLFQRTADITQKVEEGSAELGITGLDRFMEYHNEAGPAITVIEDLGFGQCELVLAVPDSWIDVVSFDDLADLALEFRSQGRQLRIATKYPRLVSHFLYRKELNYFSSVPASGSVEAAPVVGYADIIADLTVSGETLRENRLKAVEGGTILSSQACLMGNRDLLRKAPQRLEQARILLETMESHLRADSYYRLSANVKGSSPEVISASILSRPEMAGLHGPTVSTVYNVEDKDWYSVSLVVPRNALVDVVQHLRESGAADIPASQVGYLFKDQCQAYVTLLESLGEL